MAIIKKFAETLIKEKVQSLNKTTPKNVLPVIKS